MKNWLDKMRSKPQQERTRMIWIIAGCLVGALLIIWAIVGMPNRNSGPKDIINQFNTEVESNKGIFPDLFPDQK